ncbi:hypothetical protein DI041_06780 [Stenotrophomonas maltophilia]|nr:hypothetical protein DI034_04760 [Stenotrophomonas maltophilia]TIE62544.1 hypothetical protein DI041_06780 [Stenotrophomonas maltophilia]
MDAATELTWTYLQRPPQPDPPRQPTECQLLTLLRLRLRLLQGAALLSNPLVHNGADPAWTPS